MCAKRTWTTKTTKTIFFNKKQFLEYIFGKIPGNFPAGGKFPGWEVSPKKATLLSFVSVWGNRTRKTLALGPVCDGGHFLLRKVSF